MTHGNTAPGCGPFAIKRGPVCCVMLHGSLASPHYFGEAAEFMAARGFSVSAPLLAGHGTSWRDLQQTSWEELLESARAGISSAREMGCEKFILLGHSLGGALAISIAAEQPGGLIGVVTVSAPAEYPRWIREPFSVFTRLFPVLPRVLRDTMEQDAILFRRYDRLPLIFFGMLLEALPENRRLLPGVAAPLLVIHGKSDLNVPCANAGRIHREAGSPHREIWLIDGEGHGPLWYDKKNEVMERVARFMERVAE